LGLSLFQDIEKQEEEFGRVSNNLKDISNQEEVEALYKRHKESIATIKYIGGEVSGLEAAIEDIQKDQQRTQLLNWLSSIEVSENYRAALKKESAETEG
jgi:hypothetical protein